MAEDDRIVAPQSGSGEQCPGLRRLGGWTAPLVIYAKLSKLPVFYYISLSFRLSSIVQRFGPLRVERTPFEVRWERKPVVNKRNFARLGTLVVGVGIGAAWAQTPIAAADTSNDWLSSVDSLLSGAAPAASATPLDIQVSFDGMDLFSTTGNEATATTISGQYGLAIAYGDGASATAEGGTGDYALADGTDALAKAGSTTVGATGNNFDSAVDIGNNNGDYLVPDGAYAGAGSLAGFTSSAGTDSNDTAIDIGNNGLAPFVTPMGTANVGGLSGAFAGDGALIDKTGAGNGDSAYTDGNLNGVGDGATAGAGNDNFASLSGNETGTGEFIQAGFGDNNTAIADTSYTTAATSTVTAGYGNGNYAYVYGPDNSTAGAGGTADLTASHDIAYILDPFGTTDPASQAFAGSDTAAGGNDLAEVLFTHGSALAENAPLLYDIISLFGPLSGTF